MKPVLLDTSTYRGIVALASSCYLPWCPEADTSVSTWRVFIWISSHPTPPPPTQSTSYLSITHLIHTQPSPHIHDILTLLCSSSSNSFILGDLNIHISNPSSPMAADFIQTLYYLNLSQHVGTSTYSRGYTLDHHHWWYCHQPSIGVSLGSLWSQHYLHGGTLVISHLQAQMPYSLPQHQHQPRCLTLWPSTLSTTPQSMIQWITIILLLAASFIFTLPSKQGQCHCDVHPPGTPVKYTRRKLLVQLREQPNYLVFIHKLAFNEHQKAYAKSFKVAQSNVYSNISNHSPGSFKQLFQ